MPVAQPKPMTPGPAPVVYPDSDGEPMSDNTKQYEWIVAVKGNLDACVPDFVGGDLLWYPVEGDPTIRVAPDALVALGRSKGDRGSYMQWVEGGQPPQVVFEIWSPSNRFSHQVRKLAFYNRYGVEEFYAYDPDRLDLTGWIRKDGTLDVVDGMDGYVSPRLGIRFEMGPEGLVLYRPDGTRFLTFAELDAARVAAEMRADEATAKVRTLEAEVAALQEKVRAAGL